MKNKLKEISTRLKAIINKLWKFKNCAKCGKIYKPKSNRGKYCSKECYDKAQVNKRKNRTQKATCKKKCKICGKEFETKMEVQKCCSAKCIVENRKRLAVEWQRTKKTVEKKVEFELTPAQIAQRDRLKRELLRRRMGRENNEMRVLRS